MKFLFPLFFLVVAIFCGENPAFGQGFLKADGKRIVDGKGHNVLLRGIGLGGWMLQEGYMLHVNKEAQQYRIRQRIDSLVGREQTQAFYTAWLLNFTTKSDIDSLKAWGFNSVRLPMHYNLYTLSVEEEPEPGKNTWLKIGFELTDSLIAWCKMNKIYVFLDLHAAPGGQGNDLNISDRDPSKPSLWESEANKQKTIALWKKIAERYVNEPTVGGYDIINEPNWGFVDPVNDRNGLQEKKNIPLRQLMVDITRVIREVDSNHMVIIEGNGWGNNYAGILGPWDNNMVLSFHKYWNNNDQKSVQYILDYRDQYNIPVWLGETGENSNTWFTEAIRLLETNNIGWAWWPLKKLGNNNPFQVKSNPGYDALVDYWNGKTTKAPPASDVYKSLMELAEQTKNENNIIHMDVVDAMIRQPFSQDTKPYRVNHILPGSVLDAVDYDLGTNGYAYYDKDTANYRISTGKESTGNRGRIYRNDGVDIYEDTVKGTYYVGHIEDGEWLQYTIDVLEAGKYDLLIAISSVKTPGEITIDIDKSTSKSLSRNSRIPITSGNSNWKYVKLKDFPLRQGIQKISIRADKGGFNLKSITFTKR